MKKYNGLLGLTLSASIAVIGFFPRVLKADTIPWPILGASVLYYFLFSLIAWFLLFIIMQNKWLKQKISNKVLFGTIVISTVGLSAIPYYYLFSETILSPVQLADIPPVRRIGVVLTRGAVISGFYYFIIYYLQVLQEKQKDSLELERLKQAQLQANISSLKEQLSPHFLFNTLNTLSTLTQERTVKEFINELSNVYRYVLQYKENNIAMVKQELEFIESYLYIIKMRLEEAIQIHISVDPAWQARKIPPLTLQILVENAVKHNVAATYKPLVIRIYNTDKELVVENNYQPKTSVTISTGTGLNNIASRYQLLFNKEISIEHDSGSFKVKLPVV